MLIDSYNNNLRLRNQQQTNSRADNASSWRPHKDPLLNNTTKKRRSTSEKRHADAERYNSKYFAMQTLAQCLDNLIKIKLCIKMLYREIPEFPRGAVMSKGKQTLNLLCIMILTQISLYQRNQEVYTQSYMCFQSVTD